MESEKNKTRNTLRDFEYLQNIKTNCLVILCVFIHLSLYKLELISRLVSLLFSIHWKSRSEKMIENLVYVNYS